LSLYRKAIVWCNRIINNLGSNSPFITDCGAVFGKDKELINSSIIDESLKQKIISTLLKNEIYIEVYTEKNYFVLKNQECHITKKHAAVLQKPPELVDSFDKITNAVKIMAVGNDIDHREEIKKLLKSFENKTFLSWGTAPSSMPLQYGVITNKGVSKGSGAKLFSNHYNILFENILGVGDSTTDWDFIQFCKYKAAMGNGTYNLKNHVRSKSENSFIGPEVNKDGILEIFKHFGI